MRIILELKSNGNYSYDLRYHHKVQGFIYNLLKNTGFNELHDKKGYKFFCFSNIIPPKDIKQGLHVCLIISSPDEDLIRRFEEHLFSILGKNISLGEYSFNMRSAKIAPTLIRRDISIDTGTPIIIRIPKSKFGEYGIKHGGEYVYWSPRKGDPFEPFIKQLEENLIKKYITFHNLSKEQAETMESNALPLFQELNFKKSVCNHVIIDGQEHKVYGSLWKFNFQNLNKQQQALLEFGLDTGLGEKNSLGFGFVNACQNARGSYMQKGASPEGTVG